MKKKAIEKIPYIGLKETQDKNVQYIGVTAIKTIAHERHLFLEVYKNVESRLSVPVVRIVLTKKDFGNYKPEKHAWTSEKIRGPYTSDGLIWDRTALRGSWDEAKVRNILADPKDLTRIQNFTRKKIYDKGRWWEYIGAWEDSIVADARNKRTTRRYELRQQALKDRMKNIKELPEDKVMERADLLFFHNKHYLYYKKHGSYATIACTSCGGVTEARWKSGMSFESELERWTQEPREGHYGECPMCKAHGEYKCQGKAKGEHTDIKYMFKGEKYKDAGIVLRYVQITKKWVLGTVCGEKGEEMYNASEEMAVTEIARAYFEEGKPTQIDYQKYNPYSKKNFWDDCNLHGMNNITISDGWVIQETFQELKGTMFEYCGMEAYMQHEKEINPVKYLEVYQHTPQLEMLVKLNLFELVKQLMRYEYRFIVNKNAERLDQFLGIRKDKVKYLIRKQGEIGTLKTLQMEYRMDAHWSVEMVEKITESNLQQDQLETVLQYMTINKLLNAIEKYAECSFCTHRPSASARIQHIATTYADYITIRAVRGYDMTNTVYLRPRDLDAAHNKMVTEQNAEKQSERLQEVAVKFPMIRKKYRSLRKRYYYEDDKYVIRPAKSAEEIVMEGQILHHCVGGDGYLRKHNNRESIILFLRFKAEPEVPYITIEIKEDWIMQWYGAHDKKPDQENIDKWLKAYTTRLTCQGGQSTAAVGA